MNVDPLDFEPDPYLANVDKKHLSKDFYENSQISDSQARFGLPLVASWRLFPSEMEAPYLDFASRFSSCFDSTSGIFSKKGVDSCGRDPVAHIYPFEDLHVTVATFRTLLDPALDDEADITALKRLAVDIVVSATKREGWPQKDESPKFCFRLKEIRMGTKNVIILWDETSGNLTAMRRCLADEVEARNPTQLHPSFHFVIPNIVHTTCTRFWKHPTSPKMLRKIFTEEVEPLFKSKFTDDIFVDSKVKLVQEDVPCMHINHDKDHILWVSD